MTSLSPKHNFITFQPNVATALQELRESPALTVSMTYALAEMANLGATTEQLNGARNFIHTLQNLWDKGQVQQALPVKKLDTYEATDIEEIIKKAQAAVKKETT